MIYHSQGTNHPVQSNHCTVKAVIPMTLKKSLIIAVVAMPLVILAWLYRDAIVDLFDQSKPLITYYQWSTPSGDVKITRVPPQGGIEYVTFKSTDDLETDENTVDPSVLSSADSFIREHKENIENNSGQNPGSAQTSEEESSAHCRWLVGRIQELKRIIASSEYSGKSKSCKEYYKRRSELGRANCNANPSDVYISNCE